MSFKYRKYFDYLCDMTRIIRYLSVALVFALCACGGGNQRSGGTGEPAEEELIGEMPLEEAEAEPADMRPFPPVNVPMIYSNNEEAETEYIMEHFWDPYFSGEGTTNNKAILGVEDEAVEQALANYIALLQSRKALATPDNPDPLVKAQKSVKTLFSKIESNPDHAAYVRLTELVAKYLYDPNSPLRDEDLYLPFAEAAEKSPRTSDDMRPAYHHEVGACKTNSFGNKVPDIKYCDIKGRKGSLYGIHADYTMLFFSNPGCTACKEIVNEVSSSGFAERLISENKLAIVNIYIDEEISKWRDYVPNYPSSWINGYDYTFKLRNSGTYDIRAIPSLYLLDSQKRVLLKDAPTDRVLSYLGRI